MAIEKRRGCGYRKVGGTYLVSEGEGIPCDRLPIRLDVCPVCSHGFKQTRAFQWVDLAGLVGGNHLIDSTHTLNMTSTGPLKLPCADPKYCPLCHNVQTIGKAGLLWVGEKFYPKPEDFMREGRDMGFSKRVAAIPRGFKVGETWVMLAHPKTISEPEVTTCTKCEGTGEGEEVTPTDRGDEHRTVTCDECGGKGNLVEVKYIPGIFTLWRPSRIEKIFKESDRDGEEVKKAIEQGITPVFVPDDDADHAGSVYDKEEEPEEVSAT